MVRCEQNQVFEIPVQCLLQQTFPELHSETEVCHSSKPQGRRDLGRGHLPRPVPPSYASVSPFLFLSAPGLLPVLFSPFLPRTTKQGCPSLLLTQGAGEGWELWSNPGSLTAELATSAESRLPICFKTLTFLRNSCSAGASQWHVIWERGLCRRDGVKGLR